MAVVKRQQAEQLVRGAMVLDLGDLAREAKRLQDASESQAQRIVSEAEAERDRRLSGAFEEGQKKGFEAGHAEGHEKGLAEGRAQALAEAAARFETLHASWTQAMESFCSARASMLERAEQDALRLAVLFAEKVTKRCVELAPERVAVEQLRAALERVLHTSRLQIECHPDDVEAIGGVLPEALAVVSGSPHAEVVERAELERGSCRLVLPGGSEIDATVREQLARIVDAVCPAPAADERGPRATPDLAVDAMAAAEDSADASEPPGQAA